MKNSILPALTLVITFGLGFAFKTVTTLPTLNQSSEIKVTGIGGVFFKSKDPKKLTAWYQDNLGLNANPYGATFTWYEGADSTKQGQTQWTPFAETTKYFEPSAKDFMINYRVSNLEVLVEELQKNGVTIVDQMEIYDFGKFIHILDPEGNKIELWEPID